jgi:acetyl coenzyme A synthetase (ADP forming)-like protein
MTALPPRSASLTPFFTPKGVALIGASRSPAKLSYGVLKNLLDPNSGYPGPVYPVNPQADEILGHCCYPEISAVPDPVDLAILLIPAELTPAAVEACGKRGIKAAVIISGGFREVGPEGAAREQQVTAIAQRYGMRLMGPNGIGVIDTHTPLNTTFVRSMPPVGEIAFLSQSGALCGGVIDWAIGRRIGFSRLLSLGNEADVNETDALPCLAADEATRVITLYLEDIKGGPDFLRAARTAVEVKPVLAVKTGRTTGGQAATASHTGALAGAYTAFRAACRQTGVIEVDNIAGMFQAALALAYQPLPSGNRIAILTNAGGPAALAADALEPAGLTLANTGPEIRATLRRILAPDAQTAGPVDMLGGAAPPDYRQALELVLADPNNDGVLAILVPTVLINPAEVVEALAQASRISNKPLLACLMGEASLDEAFAAARRSRIPAYVFPEEAVHAFGILWQRSRWVSTPHPEDALPANMDLEHIQSLLNYARLIEIKVLGAVEGRSIVQAVGISVPVDRLVTTPEDAVEFARQVGFPVALKLASQDILHKTEVGGVILGIQDEAGARAGFQAILNRAHSSHPEAKVQGIQVQKMVAGGQEVIIGVKRDPTFGPLVMFGLGGIYVEALGDISFRLAPLSRRDAEEMIDEVRSSKLLSGLRGAPAADRAALIDALLRVGWLATHFPQISEMDLNPLFVLQEGQGVLAADVRIILGDRE